MGKYIETDSLDQLINELSKYIEELNRNKQFLLNAANACDTVMGSDEIVKKHMIEFNNAYEELNKTSDIANNVLQALIKDRAKALGLLD